VW
ncbi:rhs element Vgr family protein, partial [Escherichia coli 96.0932]|jgi:hypothetical protein